MTTLSEDLADILTEICELSKEALDAYGIDDKMYVEKRLNQLIEKIDSRRL